jgi:hypothetical protein
MDRHGRAFSAQVIVQSALMADRLLKVVAQFFESCLLCG